MKKFNVCILGASGYTGAELIRLLLGHPRTHISHLTALRHAGCALGEVFPHFEGITHLEISSSDPSLIPDDIDVVFAALPHGASAEIIKEIHEREIKIIDLGADFRLEESVYKIWYGDHPCPDLLRSAVYGIPELHEERISEAKLVANPGCYPTSAILPLAPLLENGMVKQTGIIIDSKSAASGAGRNPSLDLHFCEVSEAIKAYKVGEHRHTPEIEQELSDFTNAKIEVVFTPHLIPASRGILSTIYVNLSEKHTTRELLESLERFYRNSPFIRICPEGTFPNISNVRGSNFCDIGVWANPNKKIAIFVCAIDNLVKGASGQAIQNMNIMLDLPENTGLDSAPSHP